MNSSPTNVEIFVMIVLIAAFLSADIHGAEEYSVKPGDTLIITVMEKEQLSGTVVVDFYGNISLLPPIGTIKVEGLTPSQITGIIEEKLSEHIKNPTVFVSVKPADGFTVHVLGQVVEPSFVVVPHGTSLQEAIVKSGGFTPIADLSRIRIIRAETSDTGANETTEIQVDFSRFLEHEEMDMNPVLKRGDIIFVPRISPDDLDERTVTVIGAVRNPGVLNVTETISLMRALSLAGGISNSADVSGIRVFRRSPDGYSMLAVDLRPFLSNGDPQNNPDIFPGDTVYLPTIDEAPVARVNVIGQIVSPGSYLIDEDSSLFDVVSAAGGFSADAEMSQVTIIHRNGERSIIDVTEYLVNGDRTANPQMTAGDTIFVPTSANAKLIPIMSVPFSRSIRVSVIGEVAKPGAFQVAWNATILDLLELAGGHTTEADLNRVLIIRKADDGEMRKEVDLEQVLMDGRFDLLPALVTGDTIFVPKLKPKRDIWQTVVGFARDVSTIVMAYLLIAGKR